MNTTAMIAYLPANGDWCKQDLPHMTLVFAGETADLSETDYNAMAKDTISVARITGSFSLPVMSVDQLGDEGEQVDALIFHPTPQLLVARKLVESWNKSQHTEFLPHATIGPAGSANAEQVFVNTNNYGPGDRRGSVIPSSLYFDRIGTFWGDQKMIFNLNSYDY
jgi:2'-5' RNA ligase